MRRAWFKALMRQRILERRKTKTTRYKPWVLGEKLLAVSGSRFNAVPFGVITITKVESSSWDGAIFFDYHEEGFRTPTEFGNYLADEKLIRGDESDRVFTHEFTFSPKIPRHCSPAKRGKRKPKCDKPVVYVCEQEGLSPVYLCNVHVEDHRHHKIRRLTEAELKEIQEANAV